MKRITAFMLCLFLVLSVLAVGLAGEAEGTAEDGFVAPKIVPAKGVEDFIGEWMLYLAFKPDGTEYTREDMLANGDVDDQASLTITEDKVLIYTPYTGENEPMKHEFIAEDGSLKVINEKTEDTVILFLTDNDMLVLFVPDGDAGEGSLYFSRIEEGKTVQK